MGVTLDTITKLIQARFHLYGDVPVFPAGDISDEALTPITHLFAEGTWLPSVDPLAARTSTKRYCYASTSAERRQSWKELLGHLKGPQNRRNIGRGM